MSCSMALLLQSPAARQLTASLRRKPLQRMTGSGPRGSPRLECRARAGQQGQPALGKVAQLTVTSLGSAAACWLLLPGAAQAQTAEEAYNMYLLSAGLGAAATVLTVLAVSRFVLSFFPDLETEGQKCCQPWALLTSVDPMLRPLQKGVFGQEPGDLHLGAVVLLCALYWIMESLVGEGGLLLERVPDLALLAYMQYLLSFQHGLLLPSWTLVVARFYSFI